MVEFDAPGLWTLQLQASDGEHSVSDSVAVQVAEPSSGPLEALFVAAGATPSAADSVVIGELEDLGFDVEVVDDDVASAADGADKALVVISATAGSTKVSISFRTLAVPLISCETWVFDDLGLTGPTANVDYRFEPGQTAVTAVNPGHPLSSGLTGNVAISTGGAVRAGWGVPVASAAVVATLSGDASKATVFGYEAGAALFGGFVAPARRVGFFFDDTSPSASTPQALEMFSQAARWAAGLP
jgi:hypothetical protein